VRSRIRWLLVSLSMVVLALPASPSAADHATRPSQDMQALGHSPRTGSLSFQSGAGVTVNTDSAFWGEHAFVGNFDGFRIVDISNPANPTEITWEHCQGGQGDVVVWEDILVRSWDAPAPGPGSTPPQPLRTCDGTNVPEGFEGLHVFDISNLTNPVLVGSLALPCGSHTASLAGVEGGNAIIYSNNSSGNAACAGGIPAGDFMDIVAVPLANPAGINLVRREPLEGPTTAVAPGCHDVGVILLDVNKAVCASADTINVWDIGANATAGGSLTDPVPLITITEPGVGQAGTGGRWHSAAFTWDGQVIAAGWEPGGGLQAQCESADPAVNKSIFFYNANTGAKLGQWTLPRGQDGTNGVEENCTIHNYNVVPLRNNRHILVVGNYQAGTSVVDFTDPANAQELAWSDPPPLGPGIFCDPDGPPPAGPLPPECDAGGSWSSYWYNDIVYDTDITKGLNLFRVTDPALAAKLTINQPFLNPQTVMEALQRCQGRAPTHLGTQRNDVLTGTPENDVVVARGGKDRIRTKGGKDRVCSGSGNDRARGGGARDVLRGDKGRDSVGGQGGNDLLVGGPKRDVCNGGPGRDRGRACEVRLNIP
jgi:hypothetical protein